MNGHGKIWGEMMCLEGYFMLFFEGQNILSVLFFYYILSHNFIIVIITISK